MLGAQGDVRSGWYREAHESRLPSGAVAESLPHALWAPRRPQLPPAQHKARTERHERSHDAPLALLTLPEKLRALWRHVSGTCMDVYAAFVAFADQLITFETLLVSLAAAASVVAFVHWFSTGGAQPRRLSANLSWTMVRALHTR